MINDHLDSGKCKRSYGDDNVSLGEIEVEKTGDVSVLVSKGMAAVGGKIAGSAASVPQMASKAPTRAIEGKIAVGNKRRRVLDESIPLAERMRPKTLDDLQGQVRCIFLPITSPQAVVI